MTKYKQVRDANLNITKVEVSGKAISSWLGYCLAVARTVFGIPPVNGYGAAIDSWEKSKTKHADYNPPEGVYLPVYWSGGNAHGQSGVGHIAVAYRTGDQIEVWSSPQTNRATLEKFSGKVSTVLDTITKAYGMTKYLGWTCDVNGYTVIEKVVEQPDAKKFSVAYQTASGGNYSSPIESPLDVLTSVESRMGKMKQGETVTFTVKGY